MPDLPHHDSKKVLMTGASGLVGSRFFDLFKNKLNIKTIGRRNSDQIINLTSEKDVIKAVEESDADYVINFAAYTKVDLAEKEKGDKKGEVYIINVLLPTWLAKACKASNKILFHISTDYVFSGNKKDAPYTEDDKANPVNSWYAVTKYEAEIAVLQAAVKSSVIRISYPFSGLYQGKMDIARFVVDKLQKNETYLGITDQKIKPASVDDIAEGLALLLKKNSQGIYHIAGSYSDQYITPYQFASDIANVLGLNSSLIKRVSFKDLSAKRIAPRPQHTWLSTEKIEAEGLRILPHREALERFKKQLSSV